MFICGAFLRKNDRIISVKISWKNDIFHPPDPWKSKSMESDLGGQQLQASFETSCVFFVFPPTSCRGRKVDFGNWNIFLFVICHYLLLGTWGNDLEYDFSTYIRFAPASCLQRPILNLNLFGQHNTRYKRITYYNGPHDLHAYQNNTPAISCCERSMFSWCTSSNQVLTSDLGLDSKNSSRISLQNSKIPDSQSQLVWFSNPLPRWSWKDPT